VLSWVNNAFDSVFPCEPTVYMPAKRSMEPAHQGEGNSAGEILRLHVPKEHGTNEQVVAYEAELVARSILHSGREALADHLIITRRIRNLVTYGQKLQEYGIPYQVTGASTPDIPELMLLYTCLRALSRPDDPVALVAVLRGELFGVSDRTLYDFKRSGGRFSF